MIDFEQMKKLSRQSPSRIVLLVMDGLGGLPHPESGRTELESAKKPNLDRVAEESLCGLIDLVSPGITPGSAPGHLALFGYDPFKYNIRRGIVEALGIDLEVKKGDVAARGNFSTVDERGFVTDRRAGRISTEENKRLCQRLSQITLAGAEILVTPVREHRFSLILRGDGLSPDLIASDPQQTGVAPRKVAAMTPGARKTARLVNSFIQQAESLLRSTRNDIPAANMVLLRGFSRLPEIPSLPEIYKLTPAAIAVYPMYRGLARLVGMEMLPAGNNITEQLESLRRHYQDYDFFFIHFKNTDSRGEDGDFEAKVRAIEEVDRALPRLLTLEPDVLIVTGDHSTPATLGIHTWHPVPFMLRSKWCRRDKVSAFSEDACLAGGLGRFPATEIMPLAMANALKLDKFGA